MKKLLSLLAFGALLLAACGGGAGSSSLAATVDGTEITVGDVESLIDSGGATVPVDQFAQYLAFAIQWNILFTAAEADYDVTVSDEDVTAEADRLFNELASGDESREDFLSSRGVTEEFLAKIAEQSLIDQRVREILVNEAAEPTPEDVDQARADAVVTLTEACVSHILVETEEEATQVMTRLDNGEEFADLATELSTDTGSAAGGGDLGCTTPADYVDSFKEAVLGAPVGDVYPEPVESQFGYHVIVVTERTEPAAEELPTDEELMAGVIEETVVGDVQEWFFDSMEAAEVTVAEEYGTWTPVPPSVTPPTSTSTTISGGTTTTTSDGATTTTSG
ncbi:MAG TPA: peptidylprolyl isomerase [Acidimicrobiia bacterium]